MLAQTALAFATWSHDGGDADRVVALGVGNRGNGARVATDTFEGVLVGDLVSTRDIETAREWERGAMREGGEVVMLAVALVKAALLVLVVSVVVLMLLPLLLLFEPPITGTMGGARGVALR